ncbi:hypothetical protein CKO50_20380 [Pseudoalteromonas sp. HM-SA03]|uniref:hypothetical protein n=1 Tax=Pseudoalteromonas sp. HM-SA03 TaxID=2029678 RepID=UPI000BAE606C|nr:hypothetical protein [Pseudoalteromonas sp. HM-SA03]PAX99571.1 hypothetical protein CKO50_20380 [Pseudoalteromonas sp. HM-SA03]
MKELIYNALINSSDKAITVNSIFQHYGFNDYNYKCLDFEVNNSTSAHDLTKNILKLIHPQPRVDNTHLIG